MSAALPPLDFVSMLKEATSIVKAKPTYKRFIDGKPLDNDVPVWMADFAMQHAQQARADLEAENKRLREALQNLLNDTQHAEHPDCDDGPCPVREARAALESKHGL